MGIRTKFLIILILFSLFPLFCFYLINQKLFTKLGDDIIDIATVLLLQTTAKELQNSADNYTRNLDREFNNIVKHAQYYRNNMEKVLSELDISSQASIDRFEDILSQEMSLYYDEFSLFRKEIVSITYFSKSGFLLTYPTNKASKNAGEILAEKTKKTIDTPDTIIWNLSRDDHSLTPELREVSVGLPVKNLSGLIRGYVFVGFDLFKLLEYTRPSSLWSEYKDCLLIKHGSSDQSQADVPIILGIRSPQSGVVDWKADATQLQFASSYQKEVQDLFEGLQYGEVGYVSLPYKGELSIWAFSGTDIGLGILNILPEREALYRIARHPGRLSKWLTLDSLLIVSVVVVVMVIVVAFRSRRMLEPFFTLIAAFKSVAAGNFSTKLEFSDNDERQLIAHAFNNMTLQLEDGFRMRQGLEVAKEIQQNFFPQIDPPVSGFDIAIRMSFCEETGGDHVDVLKGLEGNVCIVVGDVTGHGIGAALHVATLRALIRSRYEIDSDLASVVTSVNTKLTKDMGDSGRFVTLFMLEINPASRSIRWVRAGHDPAWLFAADMDNITSLSGPGIILGVDKDFSYSENHSNHLKPGDIILIGTDGIWETCNPEGEQFGKGRLEQSVSKASHRSASEICDRLLTELKHFRKGQNQEDDISIVVIKVQQ